MPSYVDYSITTTGKESVIRDLAKQIDATLFLDDSDYGLFYAIAPYPKAWDNDPRPSDAISRSDYWGTRGTLEGTESWGGQCGSVESQLFIEADGLASLHFYGMSAHEPPLEACRRLFLRLVKLDPGVHVFCNGHSQEYDFYTSLENDGKAYFETPMSVENFADIYEDDVSEDRGQGYLQFLNPEFPSGAIGSKIVELGPADEYTVRISKDNKIYVNCFEVDKYLNKVHDCKNWRHLES